MSEVHRITDGKSIRIEDILAQVKAIKEFPASIHIYDRIIRMSNQEELWALLHGLELGWYLSEEYEERNRT